MDKKEDKLIFKAVTADTIPHTTLRVSIKPEYYQIIMAVKSLTGMTQQDCIDKLLAFAIERAEIDVFGKTVKMKELRSASCVTAQDNSHPFIRV